MHRYLPGYIWFCVAVISVCLLAPSVQAHARLIKSLPAQKGEIPGPNLKLELWFNELLEENFNSVEVFAAGDIGSKPRVNLAKRKPVLDKVDTTHLTLELTGLKPGEYIVEYRVLSRDGHSAPGRLSFVVTAGGK